MTNQTLYKAFIALQEAQAAVTALNKDASELATAITTAEAALQEAEDRLGHVSKEYTKQLDRVKQTKAEIDGVTAAKAARSESDYEDTEDKTAAEQLAIALAEDDKLLTKLNLSLTDFSKSADEASEELDQAKTDITTRKSALEKLESSDLSKLIADARKTLKDSETNYDNLKKALSEELVHDSSTTGAIEAVDKYNGLEDLHEAVKLSILLRSAHEAHTTTSTKALRALNGDFLDILRNLESAGRASEDFLSMYVANENPAKWDGTIIGWDRLSDEASQRRMVNDKQLKKKQSINDEERNLTARNEYLRLCKDYNEKVGKVWTDTEVIDTVNVSYRSYSSGAIQPEIRQDFFGKVTEETRALCDQFIRAYSEYSIGKATYDGNSKAAKANIATTYLKLAESKKAELKEGDKDIEGYEQIVTECKDIIDSGYYLEESRRAMEKGKSEYDTVLNQVSTAIKQLLEHSKFDNPYGAELYNNLIEVRSNIGIFRHIDYSRWDSLEVKTFQLIHSTDAAQFAGHDMFLAVDDDQLGTITKFAGPEGDYALYHRGTNIINSLKDARVAVAEGVEFVEEYKSTEVITDLYNTAVTTAYNALPTEFKDDRAELINKTFPILNASIVKAYTVAKSIKVEDVQTHIFKAMDEGLFECTFEGSLSLDVSHTLIQSGYRIFTGKDTIDHTTGKSEKVIVKGAGQFVEDTFTKISWKHAVSNQKAATQWLKSESPRSANSIVEANSNVTK